MMTEKKWLATPPQIIQTNGESSGLLTIPDTSAYKVKQKVKLQSNTIPITLFEVKRVISPTQLYLGLPSSPIFQYSDLSSFTTTDVSIIFSDEQDRPSIVPDAYNRAKYEEEPVMAERVVLVDKNGRKYDLNNPLPTSASFTGSLTINLDGTGPTGDTVGIKGINGDRVIVNSDGSLSVKDPALAALLTSIFNILDSGTLDVNDANTQSALVTTISILTNIYNFLTTGTQLVSDEEVQSRLDSVITLLSSSIDVNIGNDPLKISGTENGQPNGVEFGFVNNIRLQILSAHDRIQDITYADFGTKNQRITEIDYSSDTFPGSIARKTLTYTLVGTRYRRDSITWSIV